MVFSFYLKRDIYKQCSLILEPSAPPTSIRGHNSSSTSIIVEWGEVPHADQNGVIITYTINYQSLTQTDNGNRTVASPIKKLNLTGLKMFVNYYITLFASTVKGNGKLSGPIYVITDQDSKSFFSFFYPIVRSN